jgi:DNA-binding CsgD family transcriptional regulator/Tfp pilus assembly protein PilF
MGRSTLWLYGLGHARDLGYQVLSCRPAEPDGSLLFAGLIDLLDGGLAPLDDLPGPQRRALQVALMCAEPTGSSPGPQVVGVALVTLLRRLATSAPVVIAVDDAQWLDAASAAALTYLTRRLADAPVAVLVTARCRDADDDPMPLELDKSFRGDDLCRIRLAPLGPADLRRLVQQRTGLGLARPELLRVHQVSGGSPFAALEIAQALTCNETMSVDGPLPVPRQWRDVVNARIRALPEQSRLVLLYAATLNQPTTQQIRAALPAPGPSIPGLALAERAGLVTVEDGRVRFTHPTFAPAVYASAGGEQRRAAHWRLAEVIPNLEQRARHLALATDCPNGQVADTLEAAARRADARGAPGAAADLWIMASRRTPPPDPRRHRRLVAAARCLFSAGDSTRARVMLDEAVARAAPGPDQAHALLWLASVTFYEDSPKAAVTILRRALSLAGSDPLLTGEVHLRIAWFADYDLDLRLTSAETARRLLDLANAHPELRACALITVAYLAFLAGRGIDRDALERGRALLPTQDFSWEIEFGHSTLNMMAKCLELIHARECWQAKLNRAHDIGDEPAVPHALFHLAEIECWLGHWATAKRYAADLIEAVEQTGQHRWRGLAQYDRALVAAHLADTTGARTAATAGLALAEQIDDPLARALNLSVLGFLNLSTGDHSVAHDHLTAAADLVDGMGMREPARFTFYGDQVEAALAVGALEHAVDLLARLQRRAAISPYPYLVAITARSAALVAMATGQLNQATAAIGQALQAHDDLPMPFELARTQLVHGQVLRRRRQRRAAEQALRRAASGFTHLGAALWAPRATAELDRLGLHRSAPDQLTPTEDRIARLIAQGHGNPDVAAALFISRRTVENHLSHIYRKLGIRTRNELARLFASQVQQASTFSSSSRPSQ